MERPPLSRRVARLAPGLVLAACLASPAVAADDEPFPLEGTWYVLIHYRDEATANPDVDRWDDRLWTFEKKGSRVRWTEYPIVVFEDQTGRFGRVGRNPRARILHAWEPNELQLGEIAEGLQVNKRGMKEKSLRGSAKRGYESTGGVRTTSALTVGYQETWSITDPNGLPVFTRDDVMGTASSIAAGSDDNFSGRTRYTSLEGSPEGPILSGRFVRDENRAGTFRMMRAGGPRSLESDGRTPNEKQGERIMAALESQAYAQFLAEIEEAGITDARERIGVDELDEIWNRHKGPLMAGDPSAVDRISADVREAYLSAVADDLMDSLIEGDVEFESAMNQAVASGRLSADGRDTALAVRDAIGDERVATLRKRYGDRIREGDERARRNMRKEIEDAYEELMKSEYGERVQTGDPEAIRMYREYQRSQRDRRP